MAGDGAVRLPGLEREVPGADRRATEVVLNLVKAAGLVEAAITAHLRAHDLSPAAFNMLMIMRGADEALCPSEIGDRMLVTRGTVTGVLDSLEKRGLIRRRPDAKDRRMLRIELTAAARRLLDRIVPPLHRYEKELLAHVPSADKETLVRILGRAMSGLGA